MQDYLLDIVKHTVPLGAFSALRVDGTDTATEISATEANRQLVLKATLNAPLSDLKGTFGIPNLNLLSTILNIPEYTDSATLEMQYKTEADGTQIPFTIKFENTTRDFSNQFRLIGSKVIDATEPALTMMIDKWPVSFAPTLAAQQRFKYQLAANPDEKTAEFSVANGVVNVTLGDGGSHTGGFQFQDGVDPSLKQSISINSQYVAGVFAMAGDKTVNIGDYGMMVTVNSGLVVYNYIILKISK